jgi:hypothetical protein
VENVRTILGNPTSIALLNDLGGSLQLNSHTHTHTHTRAGMSVTHPPVRGRGQSIFRNNAMVDHLLNYGREFQRKKVCECICTLFVYPLPLHHSTLHTTPLYTALYTAHYTPLHSTPLHSTTLHYATLRYTTLHYTTPLYTALHIDPRGANVAREARSYITPPTHAQLSDCVPSY